MLSNDFDEARIVRPMASSKTFTGTYGDDYLNGTDGTAYVAHGLYGADSLTGADKADKLYGDQNNDTLTGNAGNDTLEGGSGDDNLTGGAGKDTLIGDLGNDTITIDNVSDGMGDKINGDGTINGSGTIDHGTGIDTLNFSFSASDEQGTAYTKDVTFAAADPSTNNSFMGWFTLEGIESYDLTAGSGDDKLTGFHLSDTLSGGAGDDKLSGLDGDDTLSGGSGADTLSGGSGQDSLDGGSTGDHLSGGSGDDTVVGGSGGDTIDGGAGNDTLYSNTESFGGAFGEDTTTVGADKITGGTGDDDIYIGLKDTADGGSGKGESNTIHLDFEGDTKAETFTFGTGTVKFANGGSVDHFQQMDFLGGAKNDAVTGGGGNDTLDGGLGNDTLHGGAGNDLIVEAGATVTYPPPDYTATLIKSGVDHYYGDAGSDTFLITGYDGEAKTFDGGGTGTQGKNDVDTVDFSEDFSDRLSAYVDLASQSKNDGVAKGDTFTSIEHFVGTDYDDTFIASSSAVQFDGGSGADVLIGGSGDDTLIGGRGADVMTGGKGNDVFDLTDYSASGDNWAGDEITDFTHKADKIVIALPEFGLYKTADFHFVLGTTASNDDPTFLFDKSTHQLLFDQDGKGSDYAPILVATLDNVTSLSTSDFTLSTSFGSAFGSVQAEHEAMLAASHHG